MEDTEVTESIELYDSFDIELNESFVIETGVVGFTEDGVIVEADEKTLEFLEINDILVESDEVDESALQAYLGDKKYGKDGMDALRKAGREGASKEKMAKIRAKYDKLDEEGSEDELSEIKRLSAIHEGSSDGVYNAVTRRIMLQHPEVLQKFGPKAVMTAVDDLAHDLDDLDEIGSSDVSIWTKQVIQDLESGMYSHLVDEGLGKSIIAGAALIAAITGMNKMQADHLMKTEPQLITLTQMHKEAKAEGDEAKAKQIEDRIEKTLDFIQVKGRPILGKDGKPVDPREPVGEAEYQGRKVPLGKPMKGDVAKSKVYVRKPNGKVVKVNFGDKNMRIKKNIPGRRKNFRARHNCDNPGPRWKARYWSCRAW